MNYKNECKYIWENLVPKSGQASSLQGELLRQIEKLSYEAQDNGNINWDSDFEFFCDFLNDTLCNSDAISDEEKKHVTAALMKIKSVGQVAYLFNKGEISEQVLKDKYNGELAYLEDDLYDIIRKAVGAFYAKNNELIPYEANPNIKR